MPIIVCPYCGGHGHRHLAGVSTLCRPCSGSGELEDFIADRYAEWRVRGAALRRSRERRKESLEQCARRHGYAPGLIEEIESGLHDPAHLEPS